jgi:TetR/AcrR family transcriptional regulator, regulator of cefoperazone and chloramphenicol sensitivity
LNVSSAAASSDLTARANIRNAALRLFAERGYDVVTVREIAAAAEVSPALVVHHYGSKEGLRSAVDSFAAEAFDGLFAMFEDVDPADLGAGGDATASLAQVFARAFPPGSPLPAYLRRLLLTNDPAGAAFFGRWYALTRQAMSALGDRGVMTPSADPDVRAAFLLVNDLALLLLRNQVAASIGVDPLTPEGMERWAREVAVAYTQGVFRPETGGDR